MKKYILVGFLAANSMVVAHADMMGVYLSMGPGFSRLSNNSQVNIDNNITNAYSTNKRNRTMLVSGVGIDHTFEKILQAPFNLSLGLAGYYRNFGKVNGVESPFINGGNFATLNYHFNANSTALLVESRLAYTHYAVQPYFLFGLGISWNQLHSYNEEPSVNNSGAAPANELYGAKTIPAFAYEVGLGLQRHLFDNQKNTAHFYAALDYRFMAFGKGELAQTSLMTTNNHLEIAHLNTQAVMASLKVSFT